MHLINQAVPPLFGTRDRPALGAITLLLVLCACGAAACSSGQFAKERERAEFTLLLTGGDRMACCGMVLLRDHGYLVLGRADYLNGISRAWLGLVSAQGSQLWANELSLSSQNSGLIRGASAPSGGIYGVGHTVALSGRQAALVVSVKPDGTIAWTKSLVVGIETRAAAVTVSRRAMVMIVGIGRESGNQRTVVGASLTPDGNLMWQQILLRGSDLEVNGVQELATDGYLVYGSFGLLRLDASGAQLWHNPIGEVSAALEMPNSDLVIATTPQAAMATTFQLTKLTAGGQPLWSKAIRLEEACGDVAGLWVSASGRIVAAGTRCRGPEQIWVTEFSEQGESGSISKLSVRAGASASQVGPVDDVGIIAAGMFGGDGPDRGKGWLFRGRLRN